jgi:hypothetical protein
MPSALTHATPVVPAMSGRNRAGRWTGSCLDRWTTHSEPGRDTEERKYLTLQIVLRYASFCVFILRRLWGKIVGQPGGFPAFELVEGMRSLSDIRDGRWPLSICRAAVSRVLFSCKV